MRRNFLTFVIFVLSAITLNAQNGADEKNPFVGIWQFCYVADSGSVEKNVVLLPIFKIVREDGTYTAIFGQICSTGGEKSRLHTPVSISQQGRYEIKNDSIYHEQIDRHYMSPAMEKTTTVLKYKFVGDRNEYLLQQFTNTITGVKVDEMWRRVLPMAM